MPDNQLPEPLVGPEVDISDLDVFQLHTERLIASEFVALSGGDEFKAAVLLWCRAWDQQPVCSLPDDDGALARYAGVSLAEWREIRPMALRGFVKCSDDRLYQKTLAEDALRAWEGKLKRHERTKPATEARKRKRDEQRNGQRDVGRGDECGDVRNDQRDDERNDERNVAVGSRISNRNDRHAVDDAQWRRRLKAWVETGVWHGRWGGEPPEPGDAPGPDCAISATVLDEWQNGEIDFSKIEYRRTQQGE